MAVKEFNSNKEWERIWFGKPGYSNCKTIIPPHYVRLLNGRNALVIQSGLVFTENDILEINGFTLNADFVQHTNDFGNFNWYIAISGINIDEFKKTMVFKVS